MLLKTNNIEAYIWKSLSLGGEITDNLGFFFIFSLFPQFSNSEWKSYLKSRTTKVEEEGRKKEDRKGGRERGSYLRTEWDNEWEVRGKL